MKKRVVLTSCGENKKTCGRVMVGCASFLVTCLNNITYIYIMITVMVIFLKLIVVYTIYVMTTQLDTRCTLFSSGLFLTIQALPTRRHKAGGGGIGQRGSGAQTGAP